MSDTFLFNMNNAIAKICLKLQGDVESEDFSTAYHECVQKHSQNTAFDLAMQHPHFQKLIEERQKEKLPSVTELFAEDE